MERQHRNRELCCSVFSSKKTNLYYWFPCHKKKKKKTYRGSSRYSSLRWILLFYCLLLWNHGCVMREHFNFSLLSARVLVLIAFTHTPVPWNLFLHFLPYWTLSQASLMISNLSSGFMLLNVFSLFLTFDSVEYLLLHSWPSLGFHDIVLLCSSTSMNSSSLFPCWLPALLPWSNCFHQSYCLGLLLFFIYTYSIFPSMNTLKYRLQLPTPVLLNEKTIS